MTLNYSLKKCLNVDKDLQYSEFETRGGVTIQDDMAPAKEILAQALKGFNVEKEDVEVLKLKNLSEGKMLIVDEETDFPLFELTPTFKFVVVNWSGVDVLGQTFDNIDAAVKAIAKADSKEDLFISMKDDQDEEI